MIKFTALLESGYLQLSRDESQMKEKNGAPDSERSNLPVDIPRPFSTRLLLTPHNTLKFELSELLQQILARSTYEGFKSLYHHHRKEIYSLINPNAVTIGKSLSKGKMNSRVQSRSPPAA